MRHNQIKNSVPRALALALLVFAASCSMIYDDDLRPCRNDVKVRFVYDLNMSFRDMFGRDVRSVDVWAFDGSGAPAWHGSAEGAALAEPGFFLPADLQPGTYDFVSWCGLRDNDGYALNDYRPATREELFMTLATVREGDLHVCASSLPQLFNGLCRSVTIKSATTADIEQEVVLPLVEDTNNIDVSLSGPTVGNPGEFTVFITDDNRRLDYDNKPSGAVTYRHWADGTRTRDAGVCYRLATSRLLADSEARLVVVDNSDGRRVIDIRLTDYLLKIKDNYPVRMGEQEFLDRENSYSLEFTLDDHRTFDINTIIYINGWVVVPTQVENPQQ